MERLDHPLLEHPVGRESNPPIAGEHSSKKLFEQLMLLPLAIWNLFNTLFLYLLNSAYLQCVVLHDNFWNLAFHEILRLTKQAFCFTQLYEMKAMKQVLN
jgi:hypothetical protein